MRRMEPETLIQQDIFWEALTALADFHRPMPVTELKVFRGNMGYYLCPRCFATMDREFAAFCDRCGQRLDWKDCKHAKKIYVESGPTQSAQTD